MAAQQVLGKLESKENEGKKRTLELFLEYLDEIRDPLASMVSFSLIPKRKTAFAFYWRRTDSPSSG